MITARAQRSEFNIIYKDFKITNTNKEEVKAVNKLYETYLTNITLPDSPQDKKRLDPIFTETQSAHLSIGAEFNEIGKATYLNSVPHAMLIGYRRAVFDAILKIKEYYLLRIAEKKPEDDVTFGVLSYLIQLLTQVLEHRVLTTQIEYLNVIASFIHAYGFSRNEEKSRHFTRLKEAHDYLISAKQVLTRYQIRNKEAEGMQAELPMLAYGFLTDSEQMIRIVTKLIIAKPYWNLAETVTLEELASVTLRKKYISKQYKNFIRERIEYDEEVVLPESILGDWIQDLAKYYLKSIDADEHVEDKIQSVPEMILSNDDMDAKIGDVFANSKNFITAKMQPGKKKDTQEFLTITEPTEKIGRVRIIANFAVLTGKLISFQDFGIMIYKNRDQLIDIYTKNPQQYRSLFAVMAGLSEQIKSAIGILKKQLSIIEQSKVALPDTDQKDFFNQVMKQLDETANKLMKLDSKLQEYKTKGLEAGVPVEMTSQHVRQALFEKAFQLAKMYKIHKVEETLAPVLLPAISLPLASQIQSTSLPEAKSVASVSDLDERDTGDSPKTSLSQVSVFLEKIRLRIDAIKIEDKPADSLGKKNYIKEINLYDDLFAALKDLRTKALHMMGEDGHNRGGKGESTYALLGDICGTTFEFLNKNRSERKAHARKFADSMDEALSPQNADSAFINQHKSRLLRVLKDFAIGCTFVGLYFLYKRGGIGKTDTRVIADHVGDVCDSIDHLIDAQSASAHKP